MHLYFFIQAVKFFIHFAKLGKNLTACYYAVLDKSVQNA